MKKNILKNASTVALTALLFGATLASCNNSGTGSTNADTNKMQSSDTGTMKSAPMPPMQDTMPKDTTDHKGDQKAPPRN